MGVRVLMNRESGWTPEDPGIGRLLREATRHGFPINMLCWDTLDAGMELVDRYPDTRFIVDHLGLMQPRIPPAPADAWAAPPKVIELARRPNAVIKVGGARTLIDGMCTSAKRIPPGCHQRWHRMHGRARRAALL